MTILLSGNKRYLQIAFGNKGIVAFSREQGTNDFRAWKEYSFLHFYYKDPYRTGFLRFSGRSQLAAI